MRAYVTDWIRVHLGYPIKAIENQCFGKTERNMKNLFDDYIFEQFKLVC